MDLLCIEFVITTRSFAKRNPKVTKATKKSREDVRRLLRHFVLHFAETHDIKARCP